MYESQTPAAIPTSSEFDALESPSGVMRAHELVGESALESPSGLMRAHELVDDADDIDGALALEPAVLPKMPESVLLPGSMQGVVGLSESLVEVYRVIDRVADT